MAAPPPTPPPGTRCVACCDTSIFVAEVDPANTLDFHPSQCRLDLAGWYAIDVGLVAPPRVAFVLFCQDRDDPEKSLAIRYQGEPVDETPLTDLVDPYHTDGRENVNTVSYAFREAPRRYRFERGELRFSRPPRARLDMRHGGVRSNHVELGVDLRFDDRRRFRAAFRICPTYAPTGPASDPVVEGR